MDINEDNWQEYFPEIAKAYPKITVELWCEGVLQGSEFWDFVRRRLSDGFSQRVQVAWPEMATMFEVMLVPLNNDWSTLRLTGTNSDYTFVGVDRHGCYSFILRDDFIFPSYISEKLGLGAPESMGMSLFFKKLGSAHAKAHKKVGNTET